MCDLTIVYNKNRKTIPYTFVCKVALNQANSNSNGTGILIHDGKNIHVWKSLKPYNDIDDMEKFLMKHSNAPLIAVHSRIATCGAVCEENVHPLTKDKKTYILHNGVINNTKEQPDSLELLKNHFEIEGYANFLRVKRGSSKVMFGVQTRGDVMYSNENEVLIYTTREKALTDIPLYEIHEKHYFGKIITDKEYRDASLFFTENSFKKFNISLNKRWEVDINTYESKEFDFKAKKNASREQILKTTGKYELGYEYRGLNDKYWEKEDEPTSFEFDEAIMSAEEVNEWYEMGCSPEEVEEIYWDKVAETYRTSAEKNDMYY